MSVTDSLINDIKLIVESTIPPIEPEEEAQQELGVSVCEISLESNASTKSIQEKIPSKDGEYIKKHLGTPLCLALAEIVRVRPSDPIHFLGHWLMKWRWNNDEKQRDKDKIRDLIAEQKRVEEEMAEKKRKAEARLQKEKDIKRGEALEIVALELDRMFERMELPELPEPIEPEPLLESEEKDGDDEYYQDQNSLHSSEGGRESRDDFYDDPPRSPKTDRSDEFYDDYDDYND